MQAAVPKDSKKLCNSHPTLKLASLITARLTAPLHLHSTPPPPCAPPSMFPQSVGPPIAGGGGGGGQPNSSKSSASTGANCSSSEGRGLQGAGSRRCTKNEFLSGTVGCMANTTTPLGHPSAEEVGVNTTLLSHRVVGKKAHKNQWRFSWCRCPLQLTKLFCQYKSSWQCCQGSARRSRICSVGRGGFGSHPGTRHPSHAVLKHHWSRTSGSDLGPRMQHPGQLEE